MYPINSFEEEAFCGNRSASFHLEKIYKHFTPSLRIMSTQGSHCEPPVNYITQHNKQNGASWVCVWEWNVQQKKKLKKRKETEEQAPMGDYREALVADMKAIGKFCLCSVTLQVFKW